MIITKISDGFGNQLFMYACGYAVAMRNKTQLALDKSALVSDNKRKYELDNLNIKCEKQFSVNKYRSKALVVVIRKIQSLFFSHCMRFYKDKINIGFDEGILSVKNNTYICGFWQSEKYFAEYRDDLLKLYTPKEERSESVKYLYDEMKNCNSVAVHVRRGDYLECGCQLNMDYYDQAISMMTSKYPDEKLILYIFSDDVAFCKEYFSKSNNSAVQHIELRYPKYESDNYTLDDLLLMSKCRNIIMANSSYSWWAAWLNQNEEKTVICPELWLWKDDFYPEDWIRIKCE